MLMPQSNSLSNAEGAVHNPSTKIKKMLRLEWLGQTIASTCWIVSVFTYGIASTGDWLQLAAASSWLVANISSLFSDD
tara:strand:- start:1084 stop:1317 length:234 start_codon:yes stop_codon:yes gene_type:complete